MDENEVSVLLVDDDAMVRTLMHFALDGSEFRLVGEASSAVEAVELVERRRPDLLLIDYRLPDMIGTELVRDLRRKGVDAPAVLMTANRERGFNEAAREAGAQGTFLKTGHGDEVLVALRAAHRREPAFDSRHPKRAPGDAALSPREREVAAARRERGDEQGHRLRARDRRRDREDAPGADVRQARRPSARRGRSRRRSIEAFCERRSTRPGPVGRSSCRASRTR